MLYLSLLFLLSNFSLPEITSIKHTKAHELKIPEPSDICFDSQAKTFYIVSDNGYLYETSLDGKILRKAPGKGLDYEAVCIQDSMVIAVEEMSRRIIFFAKSDFRIIKSVRIPYSGARNKGFEAITYIPKLDQLVLACEKDQAQLIFINASTLQVVNEVEIKKISDISAATYRNNSLYILSDEDREIRVFDLKTMQIQSRYKVNTLNPEGICFTDDNLYILSDDLQKLFLYDSKIIQP